MCGAHRGIISGLSHRDLAITVSTLISILRLCPHQTQPKAPALLVEQAMFRARGAARLPPLHTHLWAGEAHADPAQATKPWSPNSGDATPCLCLPAPEPGAPLQGPGLQRQPTQVLGPLDPLPLNWLDHWGWRLRRGGQSFSRLHAGGEWSPEGRIHAWEIIEGWGASRNGVCTHIRPSVTLKWILGCTPRTQPSPRRVRSPLWGCSPAVHGGWLTATTIQGANAVMGHPGLWRHRRDTSRGL